MIIFTNTSSLLPAPISRSQHSSPEENEVPGRWRLVHIFGPSQQPQRSDRHQWRSARHYLLLWRVSKPAIIANISLSSSQHCHNFIIVSMSSSQHCHHVIILTLSSLMSLLSWGHRVILVLRHHHHWPFFCPRTYDDAKTLAAPRNSKSLLRSRGATQPGLAISGQGHVIQLLVIVLIILHSRLSSPWYISCHVPGHSHPCHEARPWPGDHVRCRREDLGQEERGRGGERTTHTILFVAPRLQDEANVWAFTDHPAKEVVQTFLAEVRDGSYKSSEVDNYGKSEGRVQYALCCCVLCIKVCSHIRWAKNEGVQTYRPPL